MFFIERFRKIWTRRAVPDERTFFEERLINENLRREIQRTGVLAVLFLSSLVMVVAFQPTLYRTGVEAFQQRTYRIIGLYCLVMSLYELGVRAYIKRRFRKLLDLPIQTKILIATLEITSVSLVMYLAGRGLHDAYQIILSPLPWVYFLFIILSTLRLTFWLPAYTGILAGLQYLILCLLFTEKPLAIWTETEMYVRLPYIFSIKALSLVLGGLGAGYVTQQIRRSIMTAIRATENQKQAIALFGQQVSPEIARVMLQQNGDYEALHRHVAVMFVDIRNFTNYASGQTPEAVMEYQNAFFSVIVEVVTRHNGIVNQFLGDGCMITFGAPFRSPNPADQAVRAGLGILQGIRKAVAKGLIAPTTVGIGVHVGDAVVGNIGTETRQQYSVVGTVVILATRIEQCNKEYKSQMLISEEVYNELTKKPKSAKIIAGVSLKGLDESVRLYKLA